MAKLDSVVLAQIEYPDGKVIETHVDLRLVPAVRANTARKIDILLGGEWVWLLTDKPDGTIALWRELRD